MRHGGSVVGWDGSRGAAAALRWAAAREDRRTGSVHVVRVLLRDDPGDPADRVAAAQDEVRDAIDALLEQHPRLAVSGELVTGDPLAELTRIAGRHSLLVLGASGAQGSPAAADRRLPIAAAEQRGGIVAIVPADPPEDRSGVVCVVSGGDRSRAAVEFAARSAVELHEPLRLLRLHDARDPGAAGGPAWLDAVLQRLRDGCPDLEATVDRYPVSTSVGLLARSDRATLLVLEGSRPSAAPRDGFERSLATRAVAPFVVVSEALQPPRTDADSGRAVALPV